MHVRNVNCGDQVVRVGRLDHDDRGLRWLEQVGLP